GAARVLQPGRVDLPEDVARLGAVCVRDRGAYFDGEVTDGTEDEDRIRVAAPVESQRTVDQDGRAGVVDAGTLCATKVAGDVSGRRLTSGGDPGGSYSSLGTS